MMNCISSRLTIHGQDGMVTLIPGPRAVDDERPVWVSPLLKADVLLSYAQPQAITLRNSADGSIAGCVARTPELRDRIGAAVAFAQKKAREKAKDDWF